MFYSKILNTLHTNFGRLIMKKSATAPILGKSVNLNFEEDEHNVLLRLLSDLRRESNTTIKILEIHPELQTATNIPDKLDLHEILKILQTDNDKIVQYSTDISAVVKDYDFKDIKANGFRSFLSILHRCSLHLLTHIRNLNTQKNWNPSLINDIIDYSECFHELSYCFYFLSEMKRLGNGYSLFPDPSKKNDQEYEKLIDQSDNLKQEKFFGRCLGFYYCPSAQRILQVLGSIMSGYADSFVNNKSGLRGVLNTVVRSVNCYWNPEYRGPLMSAITRNATVEFTKQFWNLNEHPLILEAPNMILPPVEVATNFDLPPVPFTVPAKYSDPINPIKMYTIYPPTDKSTDQFTQCIKLRLISFRFRDGLSWINLKSSNDYYLNEPSFIKSFSRKKKTLSERSNHLLIHCHGGGFVSQSAKAHDTYLRSWAEQLDCPILSIDYSLSPEFPFPRALDECFYAVSWAIRNKRQLGCNSDAKVVLCGDSAGANLALCSTLKSIQCGIPVPDALFLAYVPVLVTMSPSPARLLASIDPLLPVGILARCLLAYVGINEKQFIHEMDSRNSIPSITCKNNVKSLSNESEPIINTESSPDLMDIIAKSKTKPSTLTKVRFAKIPEDPFISPLLSEDDSLSKLPPVSIIGSHFDPLLDDCVELCKRLDKVGVPVNFKVMHDIPHGFLNFVLVSRECEIASQECIKMIAQLFKKSLTIKK